MQRFWNCWIFLDIDKKKYKYFVLNSFSIYIICFIKKKYMLAVSSYIHFNRKLQTIMNTKSAGYFIWLSRLSLVLILKIAMFQLISVLKKLHIKWRRAIMFSFIILQTFTLSKAQTLTFTFITLCLLFFFFQIPFKSYRQNNRI